MIRTTALRAMLLAPLLSTPALADESRTITENGRIYRETVQEYQKLVPQTKVQDQQQTIMVEQVNTEQQTTYQTYQVPITEYRWEPYWANRWNPFSQPYLAYRYVPRTRWETRTSEIRTPVTQRKLVPQTQTVQVPVTNMVTVPERITRREFVGFVPDASQGQTAVARREPTPATGGANLGGTPRDTDWQQVPAKLR